jgi:hypothetical protein
MAKKKLTDLTGDGKVTQADVLKGRGVFNEGGGAKRYIDPTGKNEYLTEEIIELNKERDKILKASIDNKKDFNKILDDRITQGSLTDKSANLISQIHRLHIMQDKKEQRNKPKMYPRAELYDGRDFRDSKAEGGNINSQMEMMLGEEGVPMEENMSMEEEMPMEEPMVSDETMESDYLDFILDEALDEEEEDFLMEQLESNDKLSLIFDKVIDVATEFAGSGPVNGPGSGVSDSIPARLSDGEFVFTAKATEEIGADNLEAVMKEAEASADGRQQVAEGGEIEEESVEMPVQAAQQQNIRVSRPTVSALAARQEQKDIVGDEIKKRMMLDPNQKHVRS